MSEDEKVQAMVKTATLNMVFQFPFHVTKPKAMFEIHATEDHPNFNANQLICQCPSLHELTYMIKVLRIERAVTAAI